MRVAERVRPRLTKCNRIGVLTLAAAAMCPTFINHSTVILPSPYYMYTYFTIITELRPVIGFHRTIATRPVNERGGVRLRQTRETRINMVLKMGFYIRLYQITRPLKDLQRTLIIQHYDV